MLGTGRSRAWLSKPGLISLVLISAGVGVDWGGVGASSSSDAGLSEAAGLVLVCLSTPGLLPIVLSSQELKGRHHHPPTPSISAFPWACACLSYIHSVMHPLNND